MQLDKIVTWYVVENKPYKSRINQSLLFQTGIKRRSAPTTNSNGRKQLNNEFWMDLFMYR